ncbi:Putative type I restriction enzyme specificity protein [Anaerohalosphaera lusitana]|uniref:Putative type I restriction enzyme specificity protein n=1 Tax=Anaerohalosphaera lusitana TaxID=1936003 RepID=A0A1U9NQN1_9BACT|nr:restriction endonuclease subunit S [Anaerohalosphaera lusitana]AQT70087.1 Putative type I restriction enzyme specificity protein [Anaerohalosphaera lusitana]
MVKQNTTPDKVPPGYKRTEIGVIPEDWEVIELGSICERITTGRLDANAMAEDGDYPFFTCAREPYRIDKFAFDTEALLISGNGANVGYIHYYAGKFNAYQRTYVLNGFRVNIHFCKWFIDRNLQDRIRVEVKAGNTPYITMSTLSEMKIAVPECVPEQRAIAEALSDVDSLIGSLDRLIAKKRALKQAAMAELLTGKTRLPGFSGKWQTKRLGELAHIKTGSRNNQDKIEDGKYPFYVRSATVEHINSYSYEGEAILVPGEGGIGGIFHYINGRFDVHQRVYKISDFSSSTCGKFVYFAMVNSFGRYALKNTVKATVDSLRLPTFLNFVFAGPEDVAEQRAIAEVLSDMDAEIEALEDRRDKTRQIKQGMMAELLTGRTRLV